MATLKLRTPSFVDVDSFKNEFEVSSIDDIMSIDYINNIVNLYGFHRLSIANGGSLLMSEFDNGSMYYVLGYLFGSLKGITLPVFEKDK